MRAFGALYLIVALLAFSPACDDADSETVRDVEEQPTETVGPLPGDTTPPDGEDVAPGPPRTVVLEFLGISSPTTELVESSIPLQMRTYDPVAGVVVEGVPLTYRLEVKADPTGGADGSLEESEGVTDEHGMASNRFHTGSVPDTTYLIEVTAEGADDPVTLEVQVLAPGVGELHVTFEFDADDGQGGPPAPAPTHVKGLLLNEIYICDAFNPGAPPENTFLEEEMPFDVGEWLIPEIPQSASWVVLLTGFDEAGSVVAGGCRASVRVGVDSKTDVRVTMRPVGLHLPGTYALEQTLDLSAVAPSDAADVESIVRAAINGYEEVLQGFADEITEKITPVETEAKGSPRGKGDVTAPEGDVEDPPIPCHILWEPDIIEALAGHTLNPQEWLAPFDSLPSSLSVVIEEALSEVSLAASLRVSGVPPGPYSGRINWESLKFNWLGQEVTWTPEEWAELVYSIRLEDEGTTWEAQVEGYNTLVLDEHELRLEPLRIAAALVNDLLLGGQEGGPAELGDVVAPFFKCRELVLSLSDEVLTCLSDWRWQLSTTALTELCEDHARAAVEDATAKITAWAMDQDRLALSGTATLVDDTQDLGVDRIVDGLLGGAVMRAGTPAEEVTGVFSAAGN